MKPVRVTVQILTGALALLVFSGCVERRETIVVDSEGTTRVEVVVSSHDAKMLTPAVTPAEAAGWKVERSVELDKHGKPARHLATATRIIAAGQPLPSTDAAASDPEAATYLSFPTTLTIEERPDGTWYHYRRVYPARAFAWYKALENRPERVAVEATLKKPKADITPDEWRGVIRFLAEVEAQRRIAVARRATLAVTPDLKQDRWLTAAAASLAAIDTLDDDLLITLIAEDRDGAESAAIVRETERLGAAIDERMRAALVAEGGYTDAQAAAFDREYAWLTRETKLTADMDGHTYVVTLTLPGQVMGSNADETRGGTLVWKFEGNALFDRNLELIASSRLAAPRAAP